MKNHISIKFIAIILCAASLVGMVGSIAGITVLTAGDLYNKTAEQVREEVVSTHAEIYSHQLAQLYASTELGAASDSLASQLFGSTYYLEDTYPDFGYTILDAEGNVLSSYREDLKATASTYTLTPTGQYAHVVSLEPIEEPVEESRPMASDDFGAAVPAESVDIYRVDFFGLDSQILYTAHYDETTGTVHTDNNMASGTTSYQAIHSGPIGWLGYDGDGSLVYHSWLNDVDQDYPARQVLFCYFYGPNGEIYRFSTPSGQEDLGILEVWGSQIQFRTRDYLTSGSTIPAHGMEIERVEFLDKNGNLLYLGDARTGQADSESTYFYPEGGSCTNTHGVTHMGLLTNTNGFLVYTSIVSDFGIDFPDCEVYGYRFVNSQEDFVLSVQENESLGHLTKTEEYLVFTGRQTSARAAASPLTADLYGQAVPAEGVQISEAAFYGRNSDVTLYEAWRSPETGHAVSANLMGSFRDEHILNDDQGTVGFLGYDADGQLYYESCLEDADQDYASRQVTAFVLTDTSGTRYEFRITGQQESLGLMAVENGRFCFRYAVDAVPPVTEAQDTVPAATLTETFPEVTAETAEPTAAVTEESIPETIPSSASAVPETLPPETEPAVLINGKPLEEYQINTSEFYNTDTGAHMQARYVYVPMPELTVELYLNQTTMRDSVLYEVLSLVRQYRGYLFPVLGISLLCFAVFAVYLCTAAGRKPKTVEVRAGGLNRLPLDLYLGVGCFTVACIIAVFASGSRELFQRDLLTACCLAVSAAFACCLIFVAFFFAFVAQIKTPDGFWWRNTLIGHTFRLTFRFALWLETAITAKGFPFLGRTIKATWTLTWKLLVWAYQAAEKALLWCFALLGRAFRWISHRLHRFLSLLPLTWQWLLFGMVLLFLAILVWANRNDGWCMVWLLASLGLILYVSRSFGLLHESAKRMSKGDLDTKVDDKHMIGCFKDFSADLNDLAGVAVVAAQKQLKSERMKTELITNVSHDIKTPLTSIINYVDLLQKPHTPEEAAQYLEVLDRQSQRLKKLIDDLMDMSKANTGNMQVDITRLDAVEAINQALGEFAGKLEGARLTPVFRHDDAQVPMMADGRLVWRVLSNLLGNAVKYAMPGTRLYLDLMTLEGKVVISLKNISREELNIDADELMERFVRGDDSRNTEGSGLGLNIAKSLMELQKGQLQLLVDGDLFKVTLIFPGV